MEFGAVLLGLVCFCSVLFVLVAFGASPQRQKNKSSHRGMLRRREITYDARLIDEMADRPPLEKFNLVTRLERLSKSKVHRIDAKYAPQLERLEELEAEIGFLEAGLKTTRQKIVMNGDEKAVKRILEIRGKEMFGHEFSQDLYSKDTQDSESRTEEWVVASPRMKIGKKRPIHPVPELPVQSIMRL